MLLAIRRISSSPNVQRNISMSIYSIYKITNQVNNKSYIGFTNKKPHERLQKHYKTAFKDNSQYLIHRALRKYGKENFLFEVIYQSHDGNYTLKEMEEKFIRKYNTHCVYGYGYNMTYGGNGSLGRVLSEKTKKKIGTSNKGKTKGIPKTPKQRKRMSLAAYNLVKSECPNCGMLCCPGNYAKYHGNNCKLLWNSTNGLSDNIIR